MERKESIEAIKKAYEKGILGFQRGASTCKYYDSNTDSFCAVGVLIERRSSDDEDILRPFSDSFYESIDEAMKEKKIEEFKGLTINELKELQRLHDNVVIYGRSKIPRYNDVRKKYINEFKDYLYSLN